MSWLFDRRAEIASADSVEVVISVEVELIDQHFGSIDVVDLFLRAARVPRTSVLLLLPSTLSELTLSFCDGEVIELESIDPTARGEAVADLVSTHRIHRGAVLRISIGNIAPEADVTVKDVNALMAILDALW
ncbi:MAG: hypothetical protein ABI706_07785 [Ilumatobacteraceae bacterium]